MDVPSELLEKCEGFVVEICRLDGEISRLDAEMTTRMRRRDILEAERRGFLQSIEIIKAQPAPMVMPPPIPLYPGTPSGPMDSLSSASGPVSGYVPAPSSRAPRRNITDLVRHALGAAAPGEWLRIGDLVKSLDVQKSQLEKALGKLTVDWDQDMDQVRWPVEEGPSAEDKIAVGELPNGKVPEDIVELLRRSPVGLTFEVLRHDFEYTLDQVMAAVARGDIWEDARGYYHAKIRSVPVPASEATE